LFDGEFSSITGLTILAITRADRAFFASEGTDAAHVSGCSSGGFIAVLAIAWDIGADEDNIRHGSH
jgi:hypothetical protein